MSRTSPRGTLNEKRWAEILDAAGHVFDERGYQAATLEQIASRVGMLKGSLYYYIESKEDLLFEIVRRSHLAGLEFLREDADEVGRDAPTRLRNLVHRWIRGMAAHDAPGVVVEAELRHLTPERRREIYAIRRQITTSVEAIIAQGIDEGGFDPTANTWLVASTLLRVLNTTKGWFRPGRGVTLEEVADWYAHLFLAGLEARSVVETPVL